MTEALTKKDRDCLRLLQSECHIASTNYNVQMKRYINHINKQGVPIFNVDETYEKIRLAARIIAGIRDLSEVFAVSSRNYGQRAVVKFAKYTGCSVTSSSRWTPGSLTNHQTKQFKEPKVIIVADPYADFKAIKEASYANIPVIALCNSHNNLKFVDIVIPCNNTSTYSISMVFWMLAREILTLKGEIEQTNDEWSDVVVDLFYYKDPNEIEKEESVQEDGEEEVEVDDQQDGDWQTANN